MTDEFNFKYSEDDILLETLEYIQSTYGQHYANDQDDIQLFDYWQSLGILGTMARGTAMKYLARFGKKDGKNRKDLLKALHYTVLALWSETVDTAEEDESPNTSEELPVDRYDPLVSLPADASWFFTTNGGKDFADPQ